MNSRCGLAATAAALLVLSLYAACAAAGSASNSLIASGAARPDQPTIIVSLSPLQPSDKALAPLAVEGLKCAAQPPATADSAATDASGGQQQYAQALSAAAESLQQAVNTGSSDTQPLQNATLVVGNLTSTDTLVVLLDTADHQVLLNWPAAGSQLQRTAGAAAALVGRYNLLNATSGANVTKSAKSGPSTAGQFTCSSITAAPPASNPNLADSAAGTPAPMLQGNVSSLAPAEKLHAPTQPVTGIVRAVGTRFQLPDGTPFYFQGTNNYDLVMHSDYSEESVRGMLLEHWANGIKVVRVYGFDGGTRHGSKPPIQNPIGTFHEEALQRYDLVMATAVEIGIRLILCMLNYFPYQGGIDLYVKQTLGPGLQNETFYSNNDPNGPKAAYKNWVSTLANQRNTVSGLLYKEDPAVFSFEVCNECQTSFQWEMQRGLTPGQLVYDFSAEIAAFMKNDLGIQQMVSLGSTGFRAKGQYDPTANTSDSWASWMTDGSEGEDYVRNLGIPEVDFHTIHMYPQNWGTKEQDTAWFLTNWIQDRAAETHQVAGKPIVLEETGVESDWAGRDQILGQYFQAAYDAGYAGALVWEGYAHAVEQNLLNGGVTPDYKPERYDFQWGQVGTDAVFQSAARMNAKNTV